MVLLQLFLWKIGQNEICMEYYGIFYMFLSDYAFDKLQPNGTIQGLLLYATDSVGHDFLWNLHSPVLMC